MYAVGLLDAGIICAFVASFAITAPILASTNWLKCMRLEPKENRAAAQEKYRIFDLLRNIIYNTIMAKYDVVLDTNILFSGLYSQEGSSYVLLSEIGRGNIYMARWRQICGWMEK